MLNRAPSDKMAELQNVDFGLLFSGCCNFFLVVNQYKTKQDPQSSVFLFFVLFTYGVRIIMFKIQLLVSTSLFSQTFNNYFSCEIELAKIRRYSARLNRIIVLLFNTLITKHRFIEEKLEAIFIC